MNLESYFKQSITLNSIFVTALATLLYVSSILYKQTKSLNEVTVIFNHSHKIQFQIDHILSILMDAETGQRGYIITQDTILLSAYKTAEVDINNSYLKLKSLIEDNQQNNNLDTLLQLINFRIKLLANSLEIVSAQTIGEKLLYENLLRGKEQMDLIRSQISKIEDFHFSKLKEELKAYEHEIAFSPMASLLIIFFSLLVLILSYIKINNDMVSLRRSNEDLQINYESMKNAEIIGEFGITIWDLDNKELQFSDNLYRLLGCEPQSFVATVENYLQFVHPDDRDIVTTGVDKALDENKVYPRNYRIVRKDGEIRFFTSLGSFISKGNRKIHFGVGKDVTDQKLIEMALESKNLELEQRIKELDFFNRAASHDLQEPLRKIQTFISRVSSNDKVNMSETGKEYLSKIEALAKRIRSLIDDLLLFTRTNKLEKVFEITDLNLLVTSAQEELAEIIVEKNAIIQSTQLPELKVISFQIQQMFCNLISNALKYSKTGIPPEIYIVGEKLAVEDYPVFIKDNSKMYYKISISDNGIGFEQQYSEKIFGLFSRLHYKGEYPGSGIGLSLCKKIVENHDGFIIAEGKPGIGATFTIFLPA